MRLIDADKFLERVKKDREHEIYLHSWTADMVLKRLDSWYAPTVEAIPKADYENRLKADLKAILVELQLKIEESENCGKAFHLGLQMAGNIIQQKINELTSVTPQEPNTGYCRDCKWWKDSDGEYRRGVGAESQCPINRKEVYEGNGYCFLYEPPESEDNK